MMRLFPLALTRVIAVSTEKHVTSDCCFNAAVNVAEPFSTLSGWVNSLYLDNLMPLTQSFASHAALSLNAFVVPTHIQPLLFHACDELDEVGGWRAPRYDAGSGGGWSIIGMCVCI
jgi:hypothetical protein